MPVNLLAVGAEAEIDLHGRARAIGRDLVAGDETFAQSAAVVSEDIKAEPAAADLVAPPAMLEPETVIAAAITEATAAATEAPTEAAVATEAPTAEATAVPATAVAQEATAAPPAEATAAPTASAPAPAVEAPAPAGGLFSNPIVLVVIGVVVIALAAFALMRRR